MSSCSEGLGNKDRMTCTNFYGSMPHWDLNKADRGLYTNRVNPSMKMGHKNSKCFRCMKLWMAFSVAFLTSAISPSHNTSKRVFEGASNICPKNVIAGRPNWSRCRILHYLFAGLCASFIMDKELRPRWIDPTTKGNQVKTLHSHDKI